MPPSSLLKVREAVQACHSKLILTGTVAVECRISLCEAETALEELVHEGYLRRATPQEMNRTDRISAYVKV